MKELQFLNQYFIKYRGRLLAGLLITIVATIFTIVVPKKIGDSVDVVRAYINGNITDLDYVKSELLENILLIVGATLLSAFLHFLCDKP